MTHVERSGNPDLLRHAIDSGRTGDKVDFPDPAAAPLGTDDEAAGTPPTRRDVAVSLAQESARPDLRPKATGHWPISILLGAIAIIAAVVLSVLAL